MNINFSDRALRIKASEIRELLKLTDQPEIISFAGGLPAAELFPLEQIAKSANEVILTQGDKALQYSATDGYLPLRKAILEQRLNKVGIQSSVDEIMITSGSQQALEFTGKLFINEGDSIIVESPTYLGALNAFLVYDPKFREVRMDDKGMVMEDLERMLEEDSNVKFIYTIPDFQNPSGVTMSVGRRKKLLEIAKKYDLLIVEDSPYSELAFDCECLPPIKSFDTEGRVIHLGTYSKTFTPGLRIGWIVANPTILNKFIMIKQGADLQSSTIDQRIAANFMENNNLDDHIKTIIEVYRARRNVMFAAMDKYFPAGIKYTKSSGGLFTWVEFREDIDTKDLLAEALKENVAFVPGGSFFANGGHPNYARMNYSCMSEDQIEEGMKRLGKVIEKFYR